MVKDEDTIKKEIKSFIEEEGGGFSAWYSGIASKPKDRLKQHKVESGYIIRNAGSKDTAEKIEEYLVCTLGTKGGGGGGNDDTTYVYSYKIKKYTDENA